MAVVTSEVVRPEIVKKDVGRHIRFTVPGEPVPKARARTSVGRRGLTPKRTKVAQLDVAFMALQARVREQRGVDVVGWWSVLLEFFCLSSRRRDLDNLEKLVLDACTGVLWNDDYQVIETVVRRFRVSEEPRTEVTAWPAFQR